METRTLTVVEINEWACLFDGDKLIDQGHSIPLDRIVSAAKGEAVKIARVSAYDSPFDAQVSEAGDVSMDTKLSEIMPLTKRAGRR